MSGFYFLLPTLLIVFVSFLIVRAAAVALMLTGLDQKRARFQALSAFTGTGFTTHESENVVNYPKRRRIIMWLMILGNAGVVTVIVTATSSIITVKGYFLSVEMLFFIAGFYLIYKIVTHKGLMRRWENFMEDKFLKSRMFEEATTEDLLHLVEGYGLVRSIIIENSPLKNRTLSDNKLNEKGILVLGIERGMNWIPVPKGNETMIEGDKLVVYGPLDVLKKQFSQA